ncbi:Hypothetical predicted protein [Marmota monax]|uniref:Uncharacterized protein n=1 Tax=Marmota monax TaxID=9995 RepID=A0A5E4AWM9_MARMO|nr:hypothetical protein GHT09_017617 [Marmota monax]VTJ61857.1 Hypothetical predicted protein [Marmota monax]
MCAAAPSLGPRGGAGVHMRWMRCILPIVASVVPVGDQLLLTTQELVYLSRPQAQSHLLRAHSIGPLGLSKAQPEPQWPGPGSCVAPGQLQQGAPCAPLGLHPTWATPGPEDVADGLCPRVLGAEDHLSA